VRNGWVAGRLRLSAGRGALFTASRRTG